MTDSHKNSDGKKVAATAATAPETSPVAATEGNLKGPQDLPGRGSPGAVVETAAASVGIELAHVEGLEEDVIISSYVVSTFEGHTESALELVARIPGVEIHETVDRNIVATIEAASISESVKAATEMSMVDGVAATQLIYTNFEDDPTIKARRLANKAKPSTA